MKESRVFSIPRREFITSAALLALGRRALGLPGFSRQSERANQELREELSVEEKKLVEGSAMAQDVENYFGKDYSCAESLLLASLRFLGRPEDIFWAASGFGGGIYHRDLCGFLTSGVMALGLSAGMIKKERKESKDECVRAIKQYWEWWSSLAPLHCSEIRKEGTSSNVCRCLGLLSSAKIEELIKKQVNERTG
jgi:hypothetical protein